VPARSAAASDGVVATGVPVDGAHAVSARTIDPRSAAMPRTGPALSCLLFAAAMCSVNHALSWASSSTLSAVPENSVMRPFVTR